MTQRMSGIDRVSRCVVIASASGHRCKDSHKNTWVRVGLLIIDDSEPMNLTARHLVVSPANFFYTLWQIAKKNISAQEPIELREDLKLVCPNFS